MKYFEEYLIIKGHTKSTVAGMINVVNRFKNWITEENLEEETIIYNDVMAYVNTLRKQGIKQRTIQQYVGILKTYYTFLQNEKKTISTNPVVSLKVQGIKRRELYDLFTTEELDDICKNYQGETLLKRRNKVMLGLIVYQGLKTEELVALTPGDLKLREGKIEIQGNKKSKQRKIELKAFQIIDLQDYIYVTRKEILSIRKTATQKLFMSLGESDKFGNIMFQFMKELKKQNARIKNVKQIRASVITNWLKIHNLRKVQYLSGHRYISSTEMYQVGNIEELKTAIEKYHPF
jgi:integrase/recombinase XerD